MAGKNKSEPYKVNNFKGLLIDAESNGVIAEFSVSKTNEIDKSIILLISLFLILNEKLGVEKVLDISDHFAKMEMKMWDSSRPDSHAPSSLLADHTFKGWVYVLDINIQLPEIIKYFKVLKQ